MNPLTNFYDNRPKYKQVMAILFFGLAPTPSPSPSPTELPVNKVITEGDKAG